MIELENVSFQYTDTKQGVFDINLSIQKGECIVLTGPSGHGKTTLTRLINGLAPDFYAGELSGTIRIGGKDMDECRLWERGRIVGSVFQNPRSQFFSSELPGEIAFACENYGFPQKEILSRTDKSIKQFSLDKLRSHKVDILSGGEKQRVAIAGIYALEPMIYVCDEPTANLDEEGANQLANTLAGLKQQGYTLVIAEHRLAWLFDIADRLVYIQDGRIRCQYTSKDMKLISNTEREAKGLRRIRPEVLPALPPPAGKGQPAISAQGISYFKGTNIILNSLDFNAWPGQVVAITGNNGVGKSTLAKVLSGLWRENRGTVNINGNKSSSAARRRQVWYSDNDTETQFFTSCVTDELLLCKTQTDGILERARKLLKALGLYSYKDMHPAILSGGQKQRLSIACGALSDRDIMIFDEPTSGLDGDNLRLVGEIFRDLADEGKCILVITHDAELMEVCCSHRWVLS